MLPEKDQQYATTWNFMFRGSDGGTYSFAEGFAFKTLPTAGAHVYIHPQHDERTWARGKGPGIADGSGKVVAHAVWFVTDGATVSFALLRLDQGRAWSARVCAFGMPHGIDRTIDQLPVPISIYGQGSGTHPTRTPDQQDYLLYGRNGEQQVEKATPVDAGDSGAPVLSNDNQALGFVSHPTCCQTDEYTHPAGTGGIVYRLTPLINQAQARLHMSLTLYREESGVAR